MRRCVLWAVLVVGAACGSSTEPGTVTKPPAGDKTAPEITNVTLPSPYTLVYRDTLSITFQVTDPGGLQLVSAERLVFADAPNANIIDTITLNGRVASTDTVRFPGPQIDVHLPAAQITIHAVDLSGNKRDSTFLVYFTIPPSVTGGVTYKGQSTAVVPGDTVDLEVSASDGIALEWLGYRIGAPVAFTDSVAVVGTSASHDFPLVVARDWVQQSGATVTYFARNSRGDFAVGSAGANVIDGVRRAATRVPLHGAVADAAFDTKRNVLYLSQPDSDRILVFSLATNTFGTPIVIAGAPAGIDLSLSGDSLLVALRRAAAIGILDLNSGAKTQIPIPVNGGVGVEPQNLRMSANGLAIVTMSALWFTTPSGIFEFDPLYKTVLPRTEIGAVSTYTTDAMIVRSADRQKVLIALLYDPRWPLYDAGSNSFVTPNHGAYVAGALSTTTRGDRFLYGPLLYDGSLNLIRQVASPTGGPTVLTADGLAAYFGNPFGYQAFRTSDDGVIARVVSAPFTGRVLLTPAGDRLISISDSELVLEDLK
ncbi:MAG TPA: hypothetical protein VJO33_19420 [Gemmatimonadaceae bacterium]|nr:hypothetical protein [Gemmatimonadaceae bacterium]